MPANDDSEKPADSTEEKSPEEHVQEFMENRQATQPENPLWGEFAPGDGFLVGEANWENWLSAATRWRAISTRCPPNIPGRTITATSTPSMAVRTSFHIGSCCGRRAGCSTRNSYTPSPSGPSTPPTRTPSSEISAISSTSDSICIPVSTGIRERARCKVRIPTGSAPIG